MLWLNWASWENVLWNSICISKFQQFSRNGIKIIPTDFIIFIRWHLQEESKLPQLNSIYLFGLLFLWALDFGIIDSFLSIYYCFNAFRLVFKCGNFFLMPSLVNFFSGEASTKLARLAEKTHHTIDLNVVEVNGLCVSFSFSLLFKIRIIGTHRLHSSINDRKDQWFRGEKNPDEQKIIISNVRVKTKKNPKTAEEQEREKEHSGETNLLCHFSGSINFVPFWASVLRALPFLPLVFFFFPCFELLCFIYCFATQLQSIVIFIIIYLFTAHRHLLFPNVYQQKLLTRFLLLFAQRTEQHQLQPKENQRMLNDECVFFQINKQIHRNEIFFTLPL